MHKPMINMYPDLTLLCFDIEGVDDDTSEYGFAWYRTSDIIHTKPGRQANHFGRGLHGGSKEHPHILAGR